MREHGKTLECFRQLKEIFRCSASAGKGLIEAINPVLRAGLTTWRSATRVGVFHISETGSRRRFGAIWYEPASVEASNGSGGSKNGCMGRRSGLLPVSHYSSSSNAASIG